MTDFEIVKKEDVPAAPAHMGGAPPSPISLALEEGQTLFVPGADLRLPSQLSRPSSYLGRRGWCVRSRGGERNGIAGRYLWAEKKP